MTISTFRRIHVIFLRDSDFRELRPIQLVIRLRTFGICQLDKVDGDEITPLEMQPSSIAVLAYLAIARPAGRRRRDELLGIFWPEVDHNRARTALRKTLHRIRSVLGEDVVLTPGTDSLELSSENFQCDARLESAGVDLAEYGKRWGAYRLRLTPGDALKHRDVLTDLLQAAYNARGS